MLSSYLKYDTIFYLFYGIKRYLSLTVCPAVLLLDIYPKELKAGSQEDIYTPTFIEYCS